MSILLMEQDLVLRILGQIQYPWLYRHDRTLYDSHPEVDPLAKLRPTFYCSIVGYWVGKGFKRRELLFAGLFALPNILMLLYHEYNLAKSLPNYLDRPVTRSTKIGTPSVKPAKQSKKQSANPNSFPPSNNQHIYSKRFPQLQNKLYSAQDFIQQLPKSYFQ